jgi:hypothetical protein
VNKGLPLGEQSNYFATCLSLIPTLLFKKLMSMWGVQIAN